MRPDSDLAAHRLEPPRGAGRRIVHRATHRRGPLDPVPVVALLVTVILCVAVWAAAAWGIVTLLG